MRMRVSGPLNTHDCSFASGESEIDEYHVSTDHAERRSGVSAQAVAALSEAPVTKARKNPHRGSSFESFLEEEGIVGEVTIGATKRVLARRVAELMKKQRVSKATMARLMRTSRAAVDRLLDAENTAA